jgi:hypothetical protein
MSAPVELGYYTVSVKDLERGKAFYGALFGWAFDADSSHATYAHVGNTALPMGLTAGEPDALPNLYYRVAELDAALAKLKALGGSAKEPFTSGSGRSATCTDDQGTVFSLWEPAPGL